MQIGVLGLGNWGTALAQHLAAKGYDVMGWSIEQEVVNSINTQHRNQKYLSHIRLSERIIATTDLNRVAEAEIHVLVLPSAALGEVLPKIGDKAGRLVISAIKGLDSKTCRTPLQCVVEHLPQSRCVVISGPTFAKDIAAQKPAGLVAASADEAAAKEATLLFASDWMKVYVCLDPLGVELGGIVKNVIAIAAGVSDGMNLGDSARAGLITRGLAEMMRLAIAMKADPQTLAGLSGLGDLVLTATCDNSRNRTVGLRLGRGEKLPDIISSLGSVAEGVHTAPLILKLAEKYGVEMPISDQVNRLLNGEIDPPTMLKNLITRPLKKEFY
ncbi:MAG: NAD(P)H-dependent glycerol-3-phosphate dehydrogenase [Bdellovibrionota bacterium]|jgi:glycerol-3-phosphate dehydrogenase (NAD(P)+)